MNARRNVVSTLTAAAFAAGCATGGGHGSCTGDCNSNGTIDTRGESFACLFLPFLCPFIAANTGVKASPTTNGEASAVPFTAWSAVPGGAVAEASSITTASSGEGTERVSYTSSSSAAPVFEAREGGFVANPYALGWNYQSFGVWNDSASPDGMRASSFGAATPSSAVPTVGSATFSGKLGGGYVSPTGERGAATADLRVSASFSARSLDLASSRTTLVRDAGGSVAAPHLDLRGSLTYAPGSSTFTGSLVNSAGTMTGSSTGRFYGPAAQELGGVFVMRSPTTSEKLTGAYGAKR